MIIARPPAELSGVDPAADLEARLVGLRTDRKLSRLRQRLGPAREFDGVVARGKPQEVAVRAVNLLLEHEVRRQPLRERGINAILRITDMETRDRRPAVLVEHAQP